MTERDVQIMIAGSFLTAVALLWWPGWAGLSSAVGLALLWCWTLERRYPPNR
jgi:hypothetical protein